MTDKKSRRNEGDAANAAFVLEGVAKLQEGEEKEGLQLRAVAFGRAGEILGEAEVEPGGKFSIPVAIGEPQDVQLRVGPADESESLQESSAYSRQFFAKEWERRGREFRIATEFSISRLVWLPWLPRKICVSGRVRKVHTDNGFLQLCPVPFAKVEVFDVDREPCFWPFIRQKLPQLLDLRAVRIPDLIGPRPIPRPFPDPPPFQVIANTGLDPGALVGFDPQPDPPSLVRGIRRGAAVSLNPQPLPPREEGECACEETATSVARQLAESFSGEMREMADSLSQVYDASFVGEAKGLSPAIAERLSNLTLVSRIPPWLVFPRCFYSKRLVCSTTTDNCGRFQCCFKWYPFHFRNGRLRFDSKPDIILRVTQVINGVERVLYLDPYTSTRWNVDNAYVNVFVSDPDVRCGTCDSQTRPAGAQVFFTRIGNDEVYRIDQGDGLYSAGGITQVAYGSGLRVHAQFGNALSSGAPKRYYRLSYRKGAEPFTILDTPLSDTRVNKGSLFSESHSLGPVTVNGEAGLYEVRNFNSYYWYNPDWVGTWHTASTEPDTGKYTLKLEVFDENGVKLGSSAVDYRDGTVPPPAVLPSMGEECRLVITLDNRPPVVNISTPAVINECGVIPWTPGLVLNFPISVSQENNRLRSWRFVYRKGVEPGTHQLDGNVSPNGLPGSENKPVSGTDLLDGLVSTCAFDLELEAQAHIRNGYGFVYETRQNKAIAIEKCS